MSHDLVQKRYVVSILPTPTGGAGAPVDFNATGDKFIFTYPTPVDIYRFGLVTDAAMDPDAGGFVMELDLRVTAGTDTGRVNKSSLTRADAQTVAAGRTLYRDCTLPVAEAAGDDTLTGGATPQTSRVNVGPAGPVHVRPGQQAVLEVTNAVGAASTGYVWIEYAELGFAQASAVVGADGEFVTKDIT